MMNRSLKSIISMVVIATLCTGAAGATSADTKALMDKKMEEIELYTNFKGAAHNMAEEARKIDQPDSHIIIYMAKRHWETFHDKYIQLCEEYEQLETQYKRELAEEEAERKRIEEEKRRAEEERRRQAAKGRFLGSFRISAYTPSPSENGGYAVTATGRPLAGNEWAICAVDPSVIPLGSTIYIEGVGNVVACDTGGAIKGNRIDLLVGYGQANSWGVQYRNVYIK